MGTYGKLMQLDQVKQVQLPDKAATPAKPNTPAHVSSPPRPKRKAGLATSPLAHRSSPSQLAESPLFQKAQPKSPRHRDTMPPSYHDTMQPRHHATIVEAVRAAVRNFGKEAATHRFTLEEKKAIADLVYTYKRLGIKTSENEITRIGVNFLIEDYRQHGEDSILHHILTALNR